MAQHDGLHEPPGPPDMRLGSLAINARGQLDVGVDLTGDRVAQSHHFEFALDQSYLPAFIAEGENVLHRFPVTGTRDGSAGAR
jgi:hypothetical protein